MSTHSSPDTMTWRFDGYELRLDEDGLRQLRGLRPTRRGEWGALLVPTTEQLRLPAPHTRGAAAADDISRASHWPVSLVIRQPRGCPP